VRGLERPKVLLVGLKCGVDIQRRRSGVGNGYLLLDPNDRGIDE
jgi:hypothetical protein